MSRFSVKMILRTNKHFRERFKEAKAGGYRWLVGCSDDFVFAGADEDSDGIFFIECRTDEEVDALIDEYEGTLNTCRDVIDLQGPFKKWSKWWTGKIAREISVQDWISGKR